MSSSYVTRLSVIHNASSPSYCSLTITMYAYRGHWFGPKWISSKKFRSHSASSPALSKAMNSDSIVERAIHLCLDDFQDIAPPPIVKMYPLVDFVLVDPVFNWHHYILQQRLDIFCNVKHNFECHLISQNSFHCQPMSMIRITCVST